MSSNDIIDDGVYSAFNNRDEKTDTDKRIEVIAKSDTDLLDDVKRVVESHSRTRNNNET